MHTVDKKHIQLLTIPLGRREEMNMNVTEWLYAECHYWNDLSRVSGHLITFTTEFHRIFTDFVVEREREKMEKWDPLQCLLSHRWGNYLN